MELLQGNVDSVETVALLVVNHIARMADAAPLLVFVVDDASMVNTIERQH